MHKNSGQNLGQDNCLSAEVSEDLTRILGLCMNLIQYPSFELSKLQLGMLANLLLQSHQGVEVLIEQSPQIEKAVLRFELIRSVLLLRCSGITCSEESQETVKMAYRRAEQLKSLPDMHRFAVELNNIQQTHLDILDSLKCGVFPRGKMNKLSLKVVELAEELAL